MYTHRHTGTDELTRGLLWSVYVYICVCVYIYIYIYIYMHAYEYVCL